MNPGCDHAGAMGTRLDPPDRGWSSVWAFSWCAWAMPALSPAGKLDHLPGQRQARPADSRVHRVKIVATLAALPDREGVSFSRLQETMKLTPGKDALRGDPEELSHRVPAPL